MFGAKVDSSNRASSGALLVSLALAMGLLGFCATALASDPPNLKWYGDQGILNPLPVKRTPVTPETGNYIVVLEDSVRHPAAVADSQAAEVDANVKLVYRSALKGYAATMPRSEVEALEADPRVKYVAPDRKVKIASQTTPTGIERINATTNSHLHINATEDFRVDADVAVIDTGIDYLHPDLNVAGRTSCVPIDQNPGTEICNDDSGIDGNSHGTHVAGIVGARDDGIGVTGVAPGARLWAVKVLTDGGSGWESWMTAGVDWVTAHSDRIDVANMSIGCTKMPCNLPVLNEAITKSAEAGVVYTIAAGNHAAEDTVESTFAGNPDVITVSALADTDGKAGGLGPSSCQDDLPKITRTVSDDKLAWFSNYGPAVDVAAPGVCILSTLPGESYGKASGTSMAAPYVAGAAALLASASDPENLEDVEAIRETIEETGNGSWTDTSGDGMKEPLLDVEDEGAFAPSPQVASTLAPSLDSEDEVTLHGEVNAGGSPTTYQFEYGKTTEYGSKAPATPESAGSGTEFVPVSESIEGLEGHVAYHVRIAAQRGATTYYGEDRVFGTTPPTVSTEGADVYGNGAELSASVDPEGFATSYRFEYGRTTSYGRSTLPSSAGTEEGDEDVVITQDIGALDEQQTYHFRVVASNLAGTVYGEDQTLTTGPADWRVEETPGPEGPEDKGYSGLNGVSCGSEENCMSVGWVLPPGETYETPISQHWDGEDWSLEQFEPYEGEVRRENSSGLSCARGTDWCASVGSVEWEEGPDTPFLQHWDGSEWSIDAAPEILGPNVLLTDVSCFAASSCVAVGFHSVPAENPEYFVENRPTALAWNGEEWSDLDPATVSGSASVTFNGVSCTSNASCVAVGGYWTENTDPQWHDLIETYDGYEWSIVPGGGEAAPINDISCSGTDWESTKCMAISLDDAYRFDGEDWSLETVPKSVGADWQNLTGVSCASATTCFISGQYGAGGLVRPAALRWSAGEWSVQATSNPNKGGPSPDLESAGWDVACTTPQACFMAGFKRIQNGSWKTLVERVGTLPAATTKAVIDLKSNRVTLRGAVNPHSLATEYWFEYGKTTAYGSKTPISAKSVGSGSTDVEVTEQVKGLEPGTTYHYRLVATSAGGTERTSDQTFTTDELVSVFASGQVAYPGGVVADSQGDIWVSDFEGGVVKEFSPGGELLEEIGEGQLVNPGPVAIDSEGDVWALDTGSLTTPFSVFYSYKEFSPTGELLREGNEGENEIYAFNDIVAAPGGEVWTVDTDASRVSRFDSKGEFQGHLPLPYGGYGPGEIAGPTAVAFDAEGNFWLLDAMGRLQKFNSASEYLEGFNVSDCQTLSPEPVDLAIDSSGSLWVSEQSGDHVEKFSPEGDCLGDVGGSGSGTGQLAYPGQIAIDSGDDLWVADRDNNRVQVWSAPEPVLPPTATTEGFSLASDEVGPHNYKATLKGKINPAGGTVDYYFEYGKVKIAGTFWEAKVPVSPKEAGSGSSDIAVSETAKALSPGTKYAYRLVAKKNGTSLRYGETKTFSTPTVSQVASEAVSAISISGATLSGKINVYSSSAPTTYQFEYGKTTSYGSSIPVSPKELSSAGTYEVSEALSELSPGTKYYFRLAASNGVWTVYGSGGSFTTYNALPAYSLSFGSNGTTNGKFQAPYDVAVDGSGNAYVADTNNNRIQKFNSKGEYVSQFGTKGSANGQLEGPRGIAYYGGNIYVVDTGNHRVQKFNSSGEYVSKFGTQGWNGGQFWSPTGIDTEGSYIYVADTGNSRVEKFDLSGTYLAKFGTSGTGNSQFNAPADVAYVATPGGGRLLVADTGNNRIQKFDTSGSYLGQFGSKGTGNGQLEGPTAVDGGSQGTFFVLDSGNRRIQKFTEAGGYLGKFGSKGSGAEQFETPAGFTVDAEDHVWATDAALHRVLKW